MSSTPRAPSSTSATPPARSSPTRTPARKSGTATRRSTCRPPPGPARKIPHAWLINEHGHRISTLDVTGTGKFSLVTVLAGRAWVHAARKLNLPCLRTVVIGAKGTKDPYLSRAQAGEIHEASALLVRPDGYIAGRQGNTV